MMMVMLYACEHRCKTKKGNYMKTIEVVKRPSRAVRVEVEIIRAAWQEFIAQ